MGVMIHLVSKSPTGGGFPSPVDGPDVTVWPLDLWATQCAELAKHGVTVPVLPPMVKGATLGNNYDPFDHLDWGCKNQGGRVETRFGHIDQAMRFVAVARAAGMQVYVNVVHHHVDGDKGDQIYRYLGADGKTKNGRFPKDHQCFTQTWPNPDKVFDPSWDLAFGREFLLESGKYGDGLGDNGPGYVTRGLTETLGYQIERIGVSGTFFDDVKGMSPIYMGHVLRQTPMDGQVSFGELSDGQTQNLMRWMHGTPVNGASGVLDFPLRYKIRDVLDKGADIRSVLSEGVCWVDPVHSVTFIENADLALSDPIISNKLLGYAMILTFPGYPMLFGDDLFKLHMHDPIMNLVWIHETLVNGDFWLRASTHEYLVYERMGYNGLPGCLVGITKRQGKRSNPDDWTQVTVLNAHANTLLKDYTGASKDQWTDADSNVTLWIPPNENDGKGYVVFAPHGYNEPIRRTQRSTTQIIRGAFDLDVPGLKNGTIQIGRVWAAAGKPIHATLTATRTDWTSMSTSVFQIVGPDGGPVTSGTLASTGTSTKAAATVSKTGWHTIQITSAGMPAAQSPFELSITYTAPPTLSPDDYL